MTIQNYPLWPFEPNWSSTLTEVLEWLTDVMTSPTGSEQRRSLRYFPRRSFEYTLAAGRDERTLLDNLLVTYSAQRWYLPLWHDVNFTEATVPVGGKIVMCSTADSSKIEPGSIAALIGDSPYDTELVEVESVTSSGLVLLNGVLKTWPANTRIFPVRIAHLTDQPELSKRSDQVVTSDVRFLIVEATKDAGPEIVTAGPLIVDGLIVNAYHHETGRGGYFHYNSGTSEGQFIFIYGLFLAYEQLRFGSSAERAVADYYLDLAKEMLDAMGTGSLVGPMLRQPVPDNPNTITLMHWLFAARGDIPGQKVVYGYETPRVSNKLTIPSSAFGADVFKVWQIHPGTSQLLYPGAYSPAFDIVSPGAQTQIWIEDSDWRKVGTSTVITIPAGAPSKPTWKVVYGYRTGEVIPIKDGYEAYPDWTPIDPGYAACAPDTFRWFQQAMQKAIAYDTRPGAAAKWAKLDAAMRRSAVRGQSITDLREVIKPMPGFDPVPVKGDPDGMFCYSSHPSATSPTIPGADPNWTGYSFWSRASNGDIVANVPYSNVLNQVQIGRGFSERWRNAQSYQDADQYLYIAVSASKKPVAGATADDDEHFFVYLSSTMAFDADTRWYADLGSWSSFVAKTGDVIEFLIPRTDFRLRRYEDFTGRTIWGSALPAGTKIENFGISAEMKGSYQIRLRALRLVSGPSAAWVQANFAEAIKGAKMPFFPGALPFAINADTRRQQFVGWNGSPFHGYQLADYWWWLGDDADAVHPDLTVNDLPIPNPSTGALTYPITATVGGQTKPKNALLMEQQLMFLKQAQDRYQTDGGNLGPFAHTFVLNTAARETIGNPTPHTWVYVNDDPNTRWVGYHARIVESLALLADLTKADPRFATCQALAVSMVEKWLNRLNINWPDLTGKLVGGVRIYGQPTDYDNPAISAPQTLYEEPHAAALVLRACILMKRSGAATTAPLDALITRCWQYLEMMWRTEGEMRFTWSPDPENRQWYGFWHGEIITTLAAMLANNSLVPAGVNLTTVRQRLVQTQQWLQETGVGAARGDVGSGLSDVYRGFYVLPDPPDDRQPLDHGIERMLAELDNQTSIPVWRDTALRPFTYEQYAWVVQGRAELQRFENMLQTLRGRSQPIWVPTFMEDFVLVAPIVDGATTLMAARAGFTLAGGPRWDRQDIMIETISGGRIYRRITNSALDSQGRETLVIDNAIRGSYSLDDIVRVCFMTLMRLNQDSVTIEHQTDTDGTATALATFRSAPDTRVPEAASF